MKTSYYAKCKNNPNVISIAGKSPSWYTGIEYKKLAPKYEFFIEWKKGSVHNHDNNWYIEQFDELVLCKINPEIIWEELHSLVVGEPILCCYEAPKDFCHRHLVASWFYHTLKVRVCEL